MSTAVSSLTIMSREELGKGSARASRRQGFVPAIIYGDDKQNQNVQLDEREVVKGMHSHGFMSTVLDLKIDGKVQKAIVRDIQLHPVTDRPLHIDFLRVSEKSQLHIRVPIEFINEDKCPALVEGGVLNIVLHEIEIMCPANKLPDHLTIDLEGLMTGTIIHLDKLPFPEGAKAAHPERDNTIATLAAPTIAQEEEEVETTESAEGEAVAEGAEEAKASNSDKEASD